MVTIRPESEVEIMKKFSITWTEEHYVEVAANDQKDTEEIFETQDYNKEDDTVDIDCLYIKESEA